MLIQINNIKSILSKILIASKNYKKLLRIKKTKTSQKLLNVLKKKGFIYGYNTSILYLDCFIVFLKYSEGNDALLKNVFLFSKAFLFKDVRFFDKNSMYLILTKADLSLGSISNKRKKNGYLIAKF
jgi:ribosomal protein S8